VTRPTTPVLIAAVLAIAGLEIVALCKGINGLTLRLSLVLIAGVGGVAVDSIIRDLNARRKK